ncbi:MAG TPA: hypothetical protein DDX98_12100 [Bacteroidales bacterium]|jgi:uncharacterized membrane protein|nr:hypothetical protein [Bacteroidales bacterium]
MKTNQVLRIICIFIGIYYFIQFLFGLTGVGMFFSLKDNEYISREAQIFWGIISLFIMLFVGIVFFFGNRSIVRLIELCTNINSNNLENPSNFSPNLSIYIIIVGLFYFVNSLTTIVSMFPEILSMDTSFVSNWYWWNQTGSGIVGLIISIFFIFKSDTIESFITSRMSNNSHDKF